MTLRGGIGDTGLRIQAKEPENETVQGQTGGADDNRQGVQAEDNKGETLVKDKEEEVQDVDSVVEVQGRETAWSTAKDEEKRTQTLAAGANYGPLRKAGAEEAQLLDHLKEMKKKMREHIWQRLDYTDKKA